ncbi:IS3 family transposase [Cloacibacillus evryensis]|uniref:IS3 family transposase n=1 Tax=Cloacibacillus evryensis TaxID=508460 RepID=UPI003C6BDE92
MSIHKPVVCAPDREIQHQSVDVQKRQLFRQCRCRKLFSHLKAELIERVRLRDYREAKKAIDEYIWYYNNERIQIKLKMAPMKYRSLFYRSKE